MGPGVPTGHAASRAVRRQPRDGLDRGRPPRSGAVGRLSRSGAIKGVWRYFPGVLGARNVIRPADTRVNVALPC